jgi:hypothetical protein
VGDLGPKTGARIAPMAVNSTHPDYDAAALDWARARDVLSGEDAVKAGGEKYLPRLECQTDEEGRRATGHFGEHSHSMPPRMGSVACPLVWPLALR